LFKTLRSRLILSHILPFLIIAPIIGVTLAWLFETRFLMPQLTERLVSNARLLSEVTRSEYALWENPVALALLMNRLQVDPTIEVQFLNPKGRLLYSSNPASVVQAGALLNIPGMSQAVTGREVVNTNYSGFSLRQDLIDILSPVFGDNQDILGIVRVTYNDPVLFRFFYQLRLLILGVLILGLALGWLLGYGLASNISRPIQSVTKAIYTLANERRREPLQEQGPQEIRDQVRAVNYLVEQLDTLEKARRQLLANLVHEIGRPLGALRSAILALSKGAGNDPQFMDELVVGMDEEAKQLQNLLEDLAHLHDQEMGSLELKLEPILMSEWLPMTLRPWQEMAMEKNLTWQADIPPDLPPVQADPLRLNQIVGNLVGNAIRYTPSCGSVQVSAGIQPDTFWLRVSDSGPGIDPDEQDKIFLPFYRGRHAGRFQEGMGLGLSIANDLAKAHGGRISLESQPDLGAAFTVWIPHSSSHSL
jgi:signal transduction histidine kinase